MMQRYVKRMTIPNFYGYFLPKALNFNIQSYIFMFISVTCPSPVNRLDIEPYILNPTTLRAGREIAAKKSNGTHLMMRAVTL